MGKKILNKARKSITKGCNTPSRPFCALSAPKLLQPTGLGGCRSLCLERPSLGSLQGGLFFISQTSAQMCLLSTWFLVARHFRVTRYVFYPIFMFLPAPITIWKLLVIDVYLWSSASPARKRVPRSTRRSGAAVAVLFPEISPEPALSLISHRGSKNIWMNSCCPWGLQTQLPEGFSSAEDHAPGIICPPLCAELEHSVAGRWERRDLPWRPGKPLPINPQNEL